MRRGTTPTFTFTADMDCSQLDKLDISFAQRDEVVLSKGLADCVISGNEITVHLTEEDTLLFDSRKNPVRIQLRAGIGDTRIASNMMHTTAEAVLKDGCLT